MNKSNREDKDPWKAQKKATELALSVPSTWMPSVNWTYAAPEDLEEEAKLRSPRNSLIKMSSANNYDELLMEIFGEDNSVDK